MRHSSKSSLHFQLDVYNGCSTTPIQIRHCERNCTNTKRLVSNFFIGVCCPLYFFSACFQKWYTYCLLLSEVSISAALIVVKTGVECWTANWKFDSICVCFGSLIRFYPKCLRKFQIAFCKICLILSQETVKTSTLSQRRGRAPQPAIP